MQQYPHAVLWLDHVGKEEELAKGCAHGFWQEDWGGWGYAPKVGLTPHWKPCLQHCKHASIVLSDRTENLKVKCYQACQQTACQGTNKHLIVTSSKAAISNLW